MKTTTKYILTLFIMLAPLMSCSDFLNEESKKNLSEEQVYADLKMTETSLQGIYTSWSNARADERGLIVMMGLDETQQGAYQMKSEASRGGLDRYDGNLNADNAFITKQWDMRWPMVNESAKVIAGLEAKGIVAGSKAAGLLGEAYFLRGFFDFELAMYWGKIPIKDKLREETLGDGRQPLGDVWSFIISDLIKATEYSPETNNPGRATLGAAWAMLGKAYMSAPEETGLRDFDKARQCFENMMGKYNLVNFADLFDYNKPNTVESILALQYSTTYPSNNKIQFQIGSRAVQSFFGDKCYYSGYDKLLPTKYAYETTANGGIWEDGDLRKDESIRYDFKYYGTTPDLSNILWEDLGANHDELKPHVKKYEDFRTDEHAGLSINNMWYSGKNIHILRLGDIKLCYAECLNELNRTDDAIAIVNEVRARAWGGTLPADKAWSSLSKENFRIQIMDERIRELFAEYWRRIDLIRTGKYVELVKERNQWAKASGLLQAYQQKYPIPNTEIKQNTDIGMENQNEGYRN